jgi:mRNA-degrading endonuclease RelE of RelBE toxin-antitoxin system
MRAHRPDRAEPSEPGQLEVVWDLRVPEVLRRLAPSERRRAVSVILSLADEPTPPRARSLPGKPNCFRLRDGRLGFIYVLDPPTATVTVYAVTRDGELLEPGAS